MLTGFCGRTRFGRVSVYWHQLLCRLLGVDSVFRNNLEREELSARIARESAHKSPGCYFIYQAEGSVVEPVKLDVSRKVGNIGFALDAVQGERYREVHERSLHSAVTALSLALVDTNGSPDTHFIGDLIYLKGRQGLTIYPRTLQMGSPSVTVSAIFDSKCIAAANRFIPAMLEDKKIETAVSLFVQSQNKENDNLRAFIAAWSALELITNRLFKVTREEWEILSESSGLPTWDKPLRGISLENFRIRDRFFSVACVLDLAAASTDAEKFVRANDMRSGYYHRMEVKDSELPTDDVRVLFRKYLALGLAFQNDRNDKL